MNFPGYCVNLVGNLYLWQISSVLGADEAHFWQPDKTLKLVSVNIRDFVPTAADVTVDFALQFQGAYYYYSHWNESGHNESQTQYKVLDSCIVPAGRDCYFQCTSTNKAGCYIIVNMLVLDDYQGVNGTEGLQEPTLCDLVGQVFT